MKRRKHTLALGHGFALGQRVELSDEGRRQFPKLRPMVRTVNGIDVEPFIRVARHTRINGLSVVQTTGWWAASLWRPTDTARSKA